MANEPIDYGQAEIAAFNRAASAGSMHFDPDAVREAVRAYDQLIDGLRSVARKLEQGTQWSGFGGFQSAKELQAGFENKALGGIHVLNQLIEGAYRLQEAYLRAGGLIAEADQTSATALQHHSETLQGGGPS